MLAHFDGKVAAILFTFLTLPTFPQQLDIGRPPGRLVDVAGRKLHINCTGSGSPTVILEAGASAFALDWLLVQPEIATKQHVCSYDRAGSGWSDSRADVETPARIIADLHAALLAAGEKPPFVLVGASAGGLYVRLYQLDYAKDVVGLVLVDPASEDRLFTMLQGRPVAIGSLTAEQLETTLPKGGSVPIPRRSPQTGEPFDRLPPQLYGLRVKLDQRLIDSLPASMPRDSFREYQEGQRAALSRLLESRNSPENPMRDTPVIVLTRGREMTDGIAENHASLAHISKNSRQSVVSGAGHEIHLFSPEVVIKAIRDVSAAAQRRSSLP